MSVSTPVEAVTMSQLASLIDQEVAVSDWFPITQRDIDDFARVTHDTYWLHTDPVRASEGPYGATIAHGYLTMSIVVPAAAQLLSISDASGVVNYGLDRVRYPAPVVVGSRVRGVAKVSKVDEVADGLVVTMTVTGEIEGGTKPAVVADAVIRYFS